MYQQQYDQVDTTYLLHTHSRLGETPYTHVDIHRHMITILSLYRHVCTCVETGTLSIMCWVVAVVNADVRDGADPDI